LSSYLLCYAGRMRLTSLEDWNCSIARTLDVVGEWWTLLILRDVFRGTRRFDDIHESLGLARSVLTARLQKLTEHGVLERRAYSDHPPRYEYHLTDKGRALFPVIAALLAWGDEWAPNPAGPPVIFVHDTCGNRVVPELTCPHCHGPVSAANTHSEPGPGSRRPTPASNPS
jgi:DNA-binding HxlR family transcriptional regulator